MASIITNMVIVVATIAIVLMVYLTIKIYRGEARLDHKDEKHTHPRQ